MCGCLSRTPYQGPGLQPRHVPQSVNGTGDPLIRRLALNPLSHTSQGCFILFNAMTRTYDILRFNKLSEQCLFSFPMSFLMILSLRFFSLLFYFILLRPQRQNRSMFSAYSDFPIIFWDPKFIYQEVRILLCCSHQFSWNSLNIIFFHCSKILVPILKGKAQHKVCVCVCVLRGLPREAEGLHSSKGTGASQHLPKNTRCNIISALEVSRLFP